MELSPIRSPNAMAEAAYTAAIAEMEDKSRRNRDGVELESGRDSTDGCSNGASGDGDQNNDNENEDVGTRIKEMWKSDGNAEENMKETLRLLTKEVDSLIQCGLGAFYDHDATSRLLDLSKEVAETRSREAKRLQAIDEQSRQSLSTLLRAVESSKAETRDSSRSAQVEARLRTELGQLRDQRDNAMMDLSEKSRKQSLLEEELRLTKTKLNRVMHEKSNMERDSRAAMSLARSLDSNNSNDLNYFKRKVGELSDKVQSQQDTIAKQANALDELRGKSSKRSRKSY